MSCGTGSYARGTEDTEAGAGQADGHGGTEDTEAGAGQADGDGDRSASISRGRGSCSAERWPSAGLCPHEYTSPSSAQLTQARLARTKTSKVSVLDDCRLLRPSISTQLCQSRAFMWAKAGFAWAKAGFDDQG
jgi:hypothetical protein